MFVYLITNLINGKRYVGQTKQTLAQRWSNHIHTDNCKYLHNAIEKYGKENFSMESIIEVPSLELANEFEIEYIEKYCTLFPNGYNIQPGGNEVKVLSDEGREAISRAAKGNKYNLGRVTSEETKAKLRLINTGKTLSEEHKNKIASSHIGTIRSEDARKKMSLAKLGKSSARLGQIVSEESKGKMRLAKLGKKASEETKQKMKLSQQARRLREINVRTVEPTCG